MKIQEMQYRARVSLAGFSGVMFPWFVSLPCAVTAQGVTFPAAHDVTAVLVGFCLAFDTNSFSRNWKKDSTSKALKTALHEPII